MDTCAKRLSVPVIGLLLATLVLLPSSDALKAGTPRGAAYCSDSNRIFWFIHASDLHIGARGTTDSTRLQWLVTTAKNVIDPSFIVATGDLTDSTNGSLLGIPNGPYQAEWDQYKSILSGAGMTSAFFYDLPGNHDAYNDSAFVYYRANSIQGRATGGTQVSWTRAFPFGTYHFVGVNSAGNDGRPFSLSFPFGDYAGLDEAELTFLDNELSRYATANLTLVFGHHPVSDTGQSDDTWLFYGQELFIRALDGYRASTYNYGHTHDYSQALFTGNDYTGLMSNGGIHYYNVRSLGKDSGNYYSVVAIDCDGLSSVTPSSDNWPVVLVTTPVDKFIGGAANPYAYTVPAASSNVVRALVFDALENPQVSYRIDGSTSWYSMSRVATGSPVYQGAWNAAALTSGSHTIEVRAVGTTTVSDAVTVDVTAGTSNEPPIASADAYSTDYQTTLTVAAPGVLANDSDPDADVLTAVKRSDPQHGSLVFGSNGSFTYTPATGYSGSDSFTYTASDGSLSSAEASVSITVKAASTADAVTILSATYNAKRKQLSVTAKSSAQPDVTLTVVGYGTMTYKSKTKTYTLTAPAPTKPGTVTVISSRGGTATAAVT